MQYMTENEGRAHQMSLSAKQRFDRHFTSGIMGNYYAKHYHSLLPI